MLKEQLSHAHGEYLEWIGEFLLDTIYRARVSHF